MTRFEVPGAPVWMQEAWTAVEVRAGVEACLSQLTGNLPGPDETIFIKPSLGSDRPGLTGGTTDFRVLVALIEALRDRGYLHLFMGDAPAGAWGRARVDPARRLRVDRLAARYGVRWLDLNRTPATPISLPAGEVRVARAALEAALIINVPTVSTHSDVGLALGAWNLLGLVQTPDRSRLLLHSPSNLVALAARLKPAITLVDGLVAMEGDGPLEGTPIRLGRLFWGGEPLRVDLVVARLLGYTPEEVPHLWRALREHELPLEAAVAVESQLAVLRDLKRPSGRGPARRTGQMAAAWLRRSVRQRADSPGWRTVAGLMHLEEGVDARPDTLRGLERHAERCGTCRRCEEVCPVGLSREEIGLQATHSRCIECLYCFQVCGREALSLQGEGGALLELLQRDKAALVSM